MGDTAGAGEGAGAGAAAPRASNHTSRPTGAEIALVQNVLNRVMLALDDGDGEAFAGCFTPDGTCDVRLNGAHKEGADELAALCEFLHSKFATCRHWEGNVCVTAGPDGTLKNVSYWKAMDGGTCVSTGVHRDTLVHSETAGWQLKARVIEHVWTADGGHVSSTTGTTVAEKA